MRSPALPSSDLAALEHVTRRTALVRVGLVLAFVAAVGAGVVVAREPEVGSTGLLPVGTNGVVVLDASASVEGSSRVAEVLPEQYDNPNRRIRAVLQKFVESDEPVGLVLFSDVAYELLPPGSPGKALAPLTRFFTPTADAWSAGVDEFFVDNPWSGPFSGGTRISAGLSKALEMVERDATENPSIVLLSDLDAPDDPDLADVLARMGEAGVQVRVVPLVSDRARERLYTRILGEGVMVDADELELTTPPPPRRAQPEDVARAASPVAIILAGAAVLLLLALHERMLVRLPIPARSTR